MSSLSACRVQVIPAFDGARPKGWMVRHGGGRSSTSPMIAVHLSFELPEISDSEHARTRRWLVRAMGRAFGLLPAMPTVTGTRKLRHTSLSPTSVRTDRTRSWPEESRPGRE